MSRWAMLFVFAVAATGTAFGADMPAGPRSARGAPVPPPVYVERDPDVLFTPSLPYVPIRPLVAERPLLPGSSTLPGYYGSSHTYEYQGPYYGGRGILSTWDRLPYACGVYGYC
jgi:hypothetical protein